MKRFLMTLVALAGIALGSMAQTEPKVPKFTKFVIVKPGVNLRKAPSTQSPRLVSVITHGKQVFQWEKASNVKSQPVSIDGVYPVIDETSEWYHIVYDTSSNVFVYVSKKLCTPYKISPISKSYLNNCGAGNDLHIRTAGKYKGYCIMRGWFESLFTESLYVGKLKNGVLVGKKVAPNDYEIPEFLSQLKDAEIDKILVNTKNDKDIYCYGVLGISEDRNGPQDGVVDVVLDINQYEGVTY